MLVLLLVAIGALLVKNLEKSRYKQKQLIFRTKTRTLMNILTIGM